MSKIVKSVESLEGYSPGLGQIPSDYCSDRLLTR